MKKQTIIFFTLLLAIFIACSDENSSEPIAEDPALQAINPEPGDGATYQNLTPALSWQYSNPIDNIYLHDVYLSADMPLELVASGLADPSFITDSLATNTIFHWQVITYSPDGEYGSSPIWSFSTIEPYFSYIRQILFIDNPEHICVANEYLFFYFDDAIKYYNLENPSNPSYEGTFELDIENSDRPLFIDSYAIVSTDSGSVFWYDIYYPVLPELLGSYYYISTPIRLTDIALNGSIAWGTGRGMIYGFDLSETDSLHLIATFEIPGANTSMDMTIMINDDIAYILTDNVLLSLVDISSPENPSFMSDLELENETLDLAFYDNHLYLAGQSGLSVVDVEDKNNPTIVNTIQSDDDIYSVAAENKILLITDDAGNLIAYSLDSPENPDPIASCHNRYLIYMVRGYHSFIYTLYQNGYMKVHRLVL